MKILKKIWDLIFGVLFIGFAPLIVCFAFSFLMGIVSERLLPSKATGDLSYFSVPFVARSFNADTDFYIGHPIPIAASAFTKTGDRN